MSRYEIIGTLALLILVISLPVYALLEPVRMDDSQESLREQYLADGAQLYVENCAHCHGFTGAGDGGMPPLNGLGPGEANPDMLFRTIALSPHGTIMSAWHVDQGGALDNYQVEGLVTLILYGDWQQVSQLAERQGIEMPTLASNGSLDEVPESQGVMNPHECRACHEEPDIHAERFGLNCARCHTLDAWTPALLSKHDFSLEHGGEGNVPCETCHTENNYTAHTCYECHDHTPEDMKVKHAELDIFEYEKCVACHPTGEQGEGERYRDQYQP